MNKKISDLTAATTPLAGTELLEIVQGGTSKKVAASDLGGSAITAKDEGTNLTTALTSLDFVGAGVTATNTGGAVTVTIPGAVVRETLSAARTYYVRTDGSDSNDGLANTSGGAFLTVQKAIDVISYTLDCNGQTITVQVGDGTYTAGFTIRPITGGTTITVQGNSGTPTNVVISTTGSNCASNGIGGTTLIVKDMKLTTATSGSCILASAGGYVSFSGIDFGACANWHIQCQQFGRVSISGNYTISGGAAAHYFFSGYGYIAGGSKTVTISGTPAFSLAFAYSNTPAGCETSSFTFTGAATGKRYDVSANSVLYTGGGGANYFPGNVAGTTATGAQYI